MNTEALSYRDGLEKYLAQAEALLEKLRSDDEAAAWRFKWTHPLFRGKSVADVRAAKLELADAQAVAAREYGFENWAALAEFTEAVHRDERVARFESAVEAVIEGDVAKLRLMLRDEPELVRMRSMRGHRATLLHYIAANGVEGARQKTPANAVEVAKILLEAGAEVDALADMYDQKCTTMSMLVSSSHPAEAGLQVALAEMLMDYGAAVVGPGSRWRSAVLTALAFGYLNTAEALAGRAGPVEDIAIAAGLGRVAEVIRLLGGADVESRHIALSLSAQHGQSEVVRLLLDAGEDPNRYNPEGFHAHSTPLHQAVGANQAEVVRLLVERGARLDIRDKVYQATPLGWANYLGRKEIAEYLRSVGASE